MNENDVLPEPLAIEQRRCGAITPEAARAFARAIRFPQDDDWAAVAETASNFIEELYDEGGEAVLRNLVSTVLAFLVHEQEKAVLIDLHGLTVIALGDCRKEMAEGRPSRVGHKPRSFDRNLAMTFDFAKGMRYVDIGKAYNLSRGRAQEIVIREIRDLARWRGERIGRNMNDLRRYWNGGITTTMTPGEAACLEQLDRPTKSGAMNDSKPSANPAP